MNGILRGFTKLFRDQAAKDQLLFDFVLPESAFQSGVNEVQLYSLREIPEKGISLTRLAQTGE